LYFLLHFYQIYFVAAIYAISSYHHHKEVVINYCEIIINRGVLIFADFIVHLNNENKHPTKCNFPINCCL